MRKHSLSPALFVAVLFVLSGCGTVAAPDRPHPPMTATPTDPYAALTPRQVVETFMTAYQTAHYATCMALFAPQVRAGFRSPDAFALDQQHLVATQRPVTGWEFDEYRDEGAKVAAFVFIHRPMDRFVAGTSGEVEVSRINGTWKVTYFA